MDKALDHYVKRLSQPSLQASLQKLYDARPTPVASKIQGVEPGVPFVRISLTYLGERCKLWKDDVLLNKASVDTTDALKKGDLADLATDLDEMHAHVAAAANGSFLVLLLVQRPGHSPASQVMLMTPPHAAAASSSSK
jgi:hypothetical protein